MTIQRREMIARIAAASAVAALQPWQAAFAQAAWPSRTIKFVNIGPPGTAPDTYNRIYAERLSKALNVPAIIENRPGVAGNIASDVVAKAPPDGYTLLYTVSSSFTVNPWIYSKLTFAPELLPTSIHYARTVPDGVGGAREEGDRWTQALRLVDIARECFDAAVST